MLLKRAFTGLMMTGLIGVSTLFAQAHTTAIGHVSPNVPPGSNKGSAIFNVTDFGPCGTAYLDATDEIEAAVAAAIAEGDGGTIFFPKGIYLVSRTIYIGDGLENSDPWSPNIGHFISFKGEGMAVSIISVRHTGVALEFRGGLWNGNDDSYDNLSSFNSVSDLGIFKWGDISGGGAAISLRRATRPTVNNVMINPDNAQGFNYGIIIAQDEGRVHNTAISNCENGILMLGHPNATTIDDSWFFGNIVGIYVGGGAGVRIKDNTFGGNTQTGIQISMNSPHHPSASIWGLEITGNEMEGNGATSLPTEYQHNHIWFLTRLTGVPYENFAKGITIANNYFNLEDIVNAGGAALLTPYDIENTEQVREITFNRNVYQTGSVVAGTYAIRSEGMTIGKIPVAKMSLLDSAQITAPSAFLEKLSIGDSTTSISAYRSITKSWNPPSINAGASTTTTLSVKGAAIGDPVTVGLTSITEGKLNLYGAVTSVSGDNGTVTVTLVNNNSTSRNLAQGTLRVGVWKH